MIDVSVESKGVMANLENVQRTLTNMAPLEEMIAYEVLRLSQREVPHDEGTLQNSGVVEPIDGGIAVGYHTPYASRLHEHPEYHFQKGRKGKYLEDPILNNTKALGLQVTGRLRDNLEDAL